MKKIENYLSHIIHCNMDDDYDKTLNFLDAAWEGNLEEMKTLLTQGAYLHPVSIQYAASNGHLEVMKWLKEQGCPCTDEKVLVQAGYHGNLDNLKWLIEQGCVLTIKVARAICRSCELENIKWMIEQGCPMDKSCINVVTNGNLDIVNLLIEKGCPRY